VGYITRQLDEISANPPSLHDAGHKAIFSVLFDTSKSDTGGDPWVFPRAQVIDECFSLQFAGSDTVGNACMVGTYGLLTNKEALSRLRRELDVAWPDPQSPMTWEALEKLPYLVSFCRIRKSYTLA
jgi:cytochrome P450